MACLFSNEEYKYYMCRASLYTLEYVHVISINKKKILYKYKLNVGIMAFY